MRISSRELTEWMVYAELEPFGEMQAEYRAGLITSMVANTARDAKKQPKPFQPTDFMRAEYKDALPEEPPTQEMLMRKIDMAMTILGGTRGDTG